MAAGDGVNATVTNRWCRGVSVNAGPDGRADDAEHMTTERQIQTEVERTTAEHLNQRGVKVVDVETVFCARHNKIELSIAHNSTTLPSTFLLSSQHYQKQKALWKTYNFVKIINFSSPHFLILALFCSLYFCDSINKVKGRDKTISRRCAIVAFLFRCHEKSFPQHSPPSRKTNISQTINFYFYVLQPSVSHFFTPKFVFFFRSSFMFATILFPHFSSNFFQASAF